MMDLYVLIVMTICFGGHVTSKIFGDFLLITDLDKRSIYNMDISTQMVHKIAVTNVKSPAVVDYDSVEGRVIWADSYRKEINSVFNNGLYQKNILKANNRSLLYGLAIDSQTRFLFYADSGNREITKLNMDGSKITVIINTLIQRPVDIVLDTLRRRLFWADWGTDPKIDTADYDGLKRRTVINKHLKRPVGIALDQKAEIIYWCDSGNAIIEKASIDGTNRQTLHTAPPGFILNAIALYGDILFYTQSNTRSMMSVSTNGSDVKEFGPLIFSNAFSIQVVFVNEIDNCKSSPCLNNGSCTDAFNNYTCTCHLGFTGERCENGVEECKSFPCRNNGTCIDAVNEFHCICDIGFTGVTCENEIDDCQSSPCLNNGSCTDAFNNYTCTCHLGFTGERCENEIITQSPSQVNPNLITGGIIGGGIVFVVAVAVIVTCFLINRKRCPNSKSDNVPANMWIEQELQEICNDNDVIRDKQAYLNIVDTEMSSSLYDKPLNDVSESCEDHIIGGNGEGHYVNDSKEGHYSVVDEEGIPGENMYYTVY